MTQDAGARITAVIPAFNEEGTVAAVIHGAMNYVSEVLVIDDGSIDSTTEVAMKAGAQVIRIPRNSGKGNALAIGLTTAALNGSSIIVCLDADGQHNPEDIPRVIRPILDDMADMVIGSRFLDAASRELIPSYRRVGQGVLTYATNLGSKVKITDSQSGFRAFRKDVLGGFEFSETGMGIESEMAREAIGMGLKVTEVPITAKYEGLDTSTFRPGSHGVSVLGSVLKAVQHDHPLLYFGVSGLLMATVGFALGLYSIEQYIQFKALPFGPTLLAVLLAAMGVLFILVGIILNAISSMMMLNNHDRRLNGH